MKIEHKHHCHCSLVSRCKTEFLCISVLYRVRNRLCSNNIFYSMLGQLPPKHPSQHIKLQLLPFMKVYSEGKKEASK